MKTDNQSSYQATQILTATPQRLRLMLIEAAIQNAHEAIRHRGERQIEAAYQSTVRCRDIVLELLSSIRHSDGIPHPGGDRSVEDRRSSGSLSDWDNLTRSVRAVYAFLYRELSLSNLDQDVNRLREVARVLEEDRATWQAVCDLLPEAPEGWRRPQATGDYSDRHASVLSSIHIDPYSGIAQPSHAATGSQFSLDA